MSSWVATLVGDYQDFPTLGRAALETMAARRGTEVSASDRDVILGAVRSLPAHADAQPALEQLTAAGVRLATLTNSPPQVAEEQLTNAGLREYFEATFSVDAVRRYKPAPEPYRMAADQLRVPVEQVRMVAAHPWDIAGAMAAGCAAAFVARQGAVLSPLQRRPDVIGSDLAQVAELIIEREVVRT
jgi:2-haloacid dehalogenase